MESGGGRVRVVGVGGKACRSECAVLSIGIVLHSVQRELRFLMCAFMCE